MGTAGVSYAQYIMQILTNSSDAQIERVRTEGGAAGGVLLSAEYFVLHACTVRKFCILFIYLGW